VTFTVAYDDRERPAEGWTQQPADKRMEPARGGSWTARGRVPSLALVKGEEAWSAGRAAQPGAAPSAPRQAWVRCDHEPPWL